MDTAHLLQELPTPGHPEARSVARGDPSDGEAVRQVEDDSSVQGRTQGGFLLPGTPPPPPLA